MPSVNSWRFWLAHPRPTFGCALCTLALLYLGSNTWLLLLITPFAIASSIIGLRLLMPLLLGYSPLHPSSSPCGDSCSFWTTRMSVMCLLRSFISSNIGESEENQLYSNLLILVSSRSFTKWLPLTFSGQEVSLSGVSEELKFEGHAICTWDTFPILFGTTFDMILNPDGEFDE